MMDRRSFLKTLGMVACAAVAWPRKATAKLVDLFKPAVLELRPPKTWAALCIVMPSSYDTGATIIEPKVSGYRRMPVKTSLVGETTFDVCDNVGAIQAIAIMDSPVTGKGNMLWWCSVYSPLKAKDQVLLNFDWVG